MSICYSIVSALTACALLAGAGGYEAPDYLEEMVSAAVVCDWEAGLAAEAAQRERNAQLGSDEPVISFEDLLLLSKIMYAEAGSVWLSDEWKMCVGEVVLNRVASPEFANTIRDVLEQPGQYYGKNNAYFDSLCPSERCVRLALRLLLGERVLCDPSVVFQANFVQGGGVHTTFVDGALGATYFCYSIRPEIYAFSGALR